MESEGLGPAEAVAEVDRVGRIASRTRAVPIWVAPGIVGCITLIYVAFTSDSAVVYGLGSLAALVATAGLLYAASVKVRVRMRLPEGRPSQAVLIVLGLWIGTLLVI